MAVTIKGKVNETNTIVGGDIDDIIIGGNLNDTISGGSGKDTITGGAGDDMITGGLGDDVITGGAGSNTVTYQKGDGNDIINLTKGENFTLILNGIPGNNIENIKFDYSGKDLIIFTDSYYTDIKTHEHITIKNLAAVDVTNNSTKTAQDTSSVKLQIGTKTYDLRKSQDITDPNNPISVDLYTFNLQAGAKNFNGTYHNEVINAETYYVKDKQDNNINQWHDDYKKTKGLSINGNLGEDSITGSIYADTLIGGDGRDTISGNEGADNIQGGNGNDTIVGGLGNDTLSGGAGADLFIFSKGDGSDTIIDADATDTIKITNVVKNDLRYGKNGNNLEIYYDDTYDEEDRIIIQNYFSKKDGQRITTLLDRDDVEVALANVDYLLTGKGKINGTVSDDVIYGSSSNDNIQGGKGNDTIYGRDGNDTIVSGEGDDLIYGGLGKDVITGGIGANTIKYTSSDELDGDKIVLTKGENLVIDASTFGYSADYKINGNNLDVTINSKTFTIVNFAKADITNNATKTTEDTSSVKLKLNSGSGPVLVDLRDVVKSFTVDKNYVGTWHKENIDANGYIVKDRNKADITEEHADYAKTRGLNINGGLNNDSIRGSIYNDTLIGGDGDDTLIGGKGNDVIAGGKGENYIYHNYEEYFGNDTINLTKGETLHISGLEFDGIANNERYTQSKNDLLVKSKYGTLTIKNYYALNTGATVLINGVNLAETSLLPEVNKTYFYDEEKGKYKTTKYKGSALADVVDAYDLETPTKTITTKTGTIKQGVTIDTGFGNDSIDGSAFNDTILAGEGDDTIRASIGADSITGGLGANLIKYYNTDELDGDKIVLTKGENLTIDVSFANAANISYKVNGANLDVTVNDSTFTIVNFAKADITNNATKTTEDTSFVRLKVAGGNNQYVDLRDVVKSFTVDKNYVGTWHKENIDASGYTVKDRQGNDIDKEHANYAKTKGLSINGGLNDDSITGSIYNDTLMGGEGNDTLKGGKGNDLLQGVMGDNTFFFSNGDGQDTITSGKGTNDTVELYAVSGEVKFAQDTKYKRDLIIRYNGTNEAGFADSITIKNYFKTADPTKGVTSSVSKIVINGKSPVESFQTLAVGQLTIPVTTVIAELDESGNFNKDDDKSYIVKGDERSNDIQTGTGDDIIDAGEGDNNIITAGGDNLITSGSGDDTISVSGSGNNSIDAGSGNNEITVNSTGENTITAGTGHDTITLQQGTNYVTTGGGYDWINVSGGTNVIDANGSSEYVTITGGNNTINGASFGHQYSIEGGTTEVNTDVEDTGIEANIQSGALTSTNSKDYVTISGAGSIVDTRGGNDSIYANAQNSTISAGAGDDYIQIAASNNTVDGGSGNDEIRVNEAETENLSISGGEGNDTISVNSNGDATIDGGEGNDTISVSGDGKIIYGGSGSDTISIGSESTGNNTIYGGSDSIGTDDSGNWIYAQNKGNNTIYGGNGDSLTGKGDTIYAGYNDGGTYMGNNSIVGGAGNDSIIATGSAFATINGGMGNDTIDGSYNGNNVIDGGDGNDYIKFYGNNNLIMGGSGNDTLSSKQKYQDETLYSNTTLAGGIGDDTFYLNSKNAETLLFRKGDGNDTISVDSKTPEGNDTIVFEDSNLDELFVQTSGNDLIITYNKTADTPDSVTINSFIHRYNNSQNTISTIKYKNGEIFDTISITDFINQRSIIDTTGTSYTGGPFSETINGNTGAETIYGQGGDDLIYGVGGNDDINGDDGNDTLHGNNGDDTIYGGDGNDSIYGGDGNDSIYGGDGNDSIYGDEGNDTIYGDEGNDTIHGSEGDDSIYGGAGNDTINGNGDNDTIYGGVGNDTLYGGDGDDVLYADDTESLEGGEANSSSLSGGVGNDTLYGGSGNDTLKGGDGDDAIYAQYGNNYIEGGDGNNEIHLGSGNDRVYFNAHNDGTDTIYSGSGNDTIQINNSFYSDTDENPTEKKYTKDGNNLVIGTNSDGKVILNNYFTEGTSVKYIDYSGNEILLSDMKIYQKGTEHGDDGDTLTALAAHNDFIEGTDKADSITGVGLGSHNDTINYTINDLVIAGKGDDTINISDNGYAEIRIENGDGDDVITNVNNAKRVLIKYENDADRLRGYQKSDNYIIERYYKENEVWHVETTTLQDYAYDPETTKLALKTRWGSEIPLSSIHVEEYVSPKEFKRALDNEFTTLASDPVSYFVQGDGNADTVTTGLGDDVIYAYGEANQINAGNGNNFVVTGADNDTINTGVGNDTIHAGSGSNLISIAGGNNEVITSGDLNANYWDTITINGSGTNTINAGGGQNQITVGGGSNTITTGSGNDTIVIGNGTNGTNVIDAGSGNNSIDLYGAENTVTTASGRDTITVRGTTSNTITTSGSANVITVSGNSANVTITDGDQDTITLTSGGTNTINATGNYHNISASSGDNTITINGNGNNVTIAGAGANNLSFASNNNGNYITVNSTGTSAITSSANNDYIAVNSGTNTINATGGSDAITITGGANTLNMGDAIGARVYVQDGESTNTINDSFGDNQYNLYAGTTTLNLNGIDGTNSSDAINVHGGTNTINGSAYSDFINIYSGENTVDMGAGNDVIYVNDPDTLPASENTLYGGLGHDNIYAYFGNNTVYGGMAPELGDTISVDNASNGISIAGGSAEVYAGSYGDDIYAMYAIENATVYGGAGNDTISLAKAGTVHVEAGAGNDSIISSKTGNSTIDGGAGNDSIEVYVGNSNVINGGAGNDTIITFNTSYDGQKYATITGGAGNDSISLDGTFIETLEFNAGDGHDTIDCSTGEDILKFNGINLDDITVTYHDSGDHETVIKYNDGIDSVTLYGDHPLFNKIITADNLEGISFADFMNQRSVTELEPQSTIQGAYYNGNQYNENITGTALGDTILGKYGNDTIHGGAGNDSISGGYDDDILYGDDGNDTLYGDDGNDTMYGGAGDDEFDCQLGSNTIYGGAGNDTINAYLSFDALDEGNSNTFVFAAGDGIDTVRNYSTIEGGLSKVFTTLQFNGIDDYDDLNISYEYDNESEHSDLVIQYGANEDDKVVLKNYSKANKNNVNIKIDEHELTDLNTILSDKHIILPTGEWNSTVNGSVSDDYIYANYGNTIIIGGAGDDTIESIGNTAAITYKFSRFGDGEDVIINSDIGGSKIVFTGFTEAEYNNGIEFFSKYFTDNVHYLMDGDDLVISYGETTPSTIRILDYGYLGAGSHIEYITMEDDRGYTNNVPIENVLQIRADVEEGVEFIGDNNINQYVIGTAGDDTINAGAGDPYDYDYRIGTNVINPMAGQDTIILANCYDNEENLITMDQTLRINMGDTYTAGADLLWFKGVDSMSELFIDNDGSDLIIGTFKAGITNHRVIIHNYLSSLDPSFATIKVGEDGETSFTIADLAAAKHFDFDIDNRQKELSTIQGSVLNDYILTSANVAESVIGGKGNDTVTAIFESLQKDPQADTVHGGLGNDYIDYSYYGNDGLLLYGDEGNDNITISGGTAYGGVGSDYIMTSDDNNYYEEHGTFRTVTIYGGTSDGIGESEDDTDTIVANSTANTRLEVHGGIGTNNIGGGANDDTLYGNLHNDTINGWDGDDIIYGYAGDDSIDGGNGDNYIDAGDGDDTIKARSGDYNTIYGGAGNDSILATDTTNISHINTTCLSGEATIHGGAGNDTIWTRNTYNEIWGDEGDDIIYTAKDSKTTFHFKSGDGNDSIYSSEKSMSLDGDIIILDDIEYTGDNIRGHFDTTNNRAIIEYKNNETGEWDSSITIDKYLMATSGTSINTDTSTSKGRWSSIGYIVDKTGKKITLKNILTYPEKTGVTNNYSHTILSDNMTFGNTYAYTYWGGEGSDTLIGTSYNDTIYGDMDTENGLLLASSIVDPGDDYIDGGLGANVLYGGAGNDTIVTGNDSNVDTIYGGAGANTYIIKSNGDAETKVAEIHSVSASDVLYFKDAVGPFLSYKDGNDLKINYYGNSRYNNITLKDYFLAPHNYKVIYNNGATETYLHNMFTSSRFYSAATFINGTTVTDEGYAALRFGSQNADTISYSGSDNTIIGGAGDDKITPSSGNAVTHGGDGDDTIVSGEGIIFGGNGNDKINTMDNATIYGGAGADSITGSSSKELIFTGGKPNGDLADYTNRVYYEGYVDIYEGFGAANANSMVYAGGGNDTICAFGENIYSINGGDGDDSYHTMLTNNIYIKDLNGTNTLQLHSVSRKEQAYIVMDVNSQESGGDLNSLYVVNKENYLDWLENNGSFSEGHGGVKLYNTDSVDTITSSENYYTTTANLNSLKSEIASWLDTDGCGDVAEALASSENKDDLIAIFNTFNNHTGGGWTQNS